MLKQENERHSSLSKFFFNDQGLGENISMVAFIFKIKVLVVSESFRVKA
jgi:hypothetical protein